MVYCAFERTEAVLPWNVRSLHGLSGCGVPGYVRAMTMVVRALHVLNEPMVVPSRREVV